MLHLYTSFFFLAFVNAEIRQIDIPPMLRNCLCDISAHENFTSVKGDSATGFCLNQFKWFNAKGKVKVVRNESAKNFIDHLFRKRTRRQTHGYEEGYELRVRKEYRMMTDEERRRYHNAVIALHNDKSVSPNKYIAISNVHNPVDAKFAHSGASFLPWHRVYLNKYEEALREVDETVTLPYWDCTLDDPTSFKDSVIFSEEFAGNGDGFVKDGPFKTWTHPNFGRLNRDVGRRKGLMTREDLKKILSETSTSNIIYKSENDLERMHNKIHLSVGGHMADLETASFDPIFFMVHAFVDYVWWLFRKNQEENGIDPSEDYPANQPLEYQPDSPMGGLHGYKNIDGFSNEWTDEIYTYQESPTSCRVDNDCGSKYLRCKNRFCVSETKKQLKRRRRAEKANVSDKCRIVLVQNEVKEEASSTCRNLDTTFQNIFSMNGHLRMKDWAYLPIKVIYERRMNELFRSFSINDNGEPLTDSDLYESLNNILIKLVGNGRVAKSKSCHESGSGANTVFVQVDGLNYDGSTGDYSVVDERYELSSSYTYVPFRKPTKGKPTEIFLTAFDSCGTLCKPYCRTKYGFEPCLGALKIDSRSSHMYGTTLAEAMLRIWIQPSFTLLESTDKNIYVVFFCDKSEIWPWENMASSKRRRKKPFC